MHASPDPLSSLLRTLRVDGLRHGRLEAHGPWSSTVPVDAEDETHLFIVREGEVWVDVAGQEGCWRTHYGRGDVGVLRCGHTFIARDAPDRPPVPSANLDAVIEGVRVRIGHGERQADLETISARVHENALAPLLGVVAPVLHLPAGDPVTRPLATALRGLFRDLAAERPGALAAAERLTETLVVEAVRRAISPAGLAVGSFGKAPADPPIAAAMVLIHAAPEAPWTLATLADRVSLSRTAFAERFTRGAGETPFRYLSRCRCERAVHMLRHTTLSLAEIARRVGYPTPAAFHKAFKRWTGRRPGQVRATSAPVPLRGPLRHTASPTAPGSSEALEPA